MRLLPDGTIEFDAAELDSVLAARERVAKRVGQPASTPQNSHVGAPKATPASPPTPAAEDEEEDPIVGFMERAHQKPMQLIVLKTLRARGSVTMPEMIEALGVEDSQGVSGVMSGLRKNANKREIDLEDYVKSERNEEGVMVYTAGPRLASLPLE